MSQMMLVVLTVTVHWSEVLKKKWQNKLIIIIICPRFILVKFLGVLQTNHNRTFRKGSTFVSALAFLSPSASFLDVSFDWFMSFPFPFNSSINKNDSILSRDAKQSAISCMPSVSPYTRERLFSDNNPTMVKTLNGVRRIPVKMSVMNAIRQITLSYVCCREAKVERML